jgi:hypothetical protein
LLDLILELNIQESALSKHFINGTIYLKNFTFSARSGGLIPGTHEQFFTLTELKMKQLRAKNS